MTAQPENSIRESLATPMPIVPAFLPPIEPTPDAAKPIPFWAAFFLYPFRRKWGPHLAAGPVSSAFAAHLLAMCITMVLGVATFLIATSDATGIAGLRLRLGMLVRDAIVASARTSSPGMNGWFIVGAPMIFTLTLLTIALLSAYAADAGDGLKSACKRSVNDTLWMTTVLPWLGAFALVLCLIQRFMNARIAHTGIPSLMEMMIHGATIGVLIGAVGLFLVVRTWRAGIAGYVGPATGPGYEPRRPHCEDCGYLIGGLPLESRCPECGLAVADSMPTGRRASMAPLDERLSIVRPNEYARFWIWLLTDRKATQNLPMFGFSAARRFWRIGYAYGMAASMLILIPFGLVADLMNDRTASSVTALAMIVIVSSPLLQLVMAGAAVIIGRMQFGIEDTRVCRTVANYAAVVLGPMAVMVILQTLVVFIQPLRGWRLNVLGASIDIVAIPSIAIGVVLIYLFIEWFRRCITGLRSAAIANS